MGSDSSIEWNINRQKHLIPFVSYYELLGVPRNSDANVIMKAYRTIAKQLHPDLNMAKSIETRSRLENRLKKVNRAFEVLYDKEKKQTYDNHLSDQETQWNELQKSKLDNRIKKAHEFMEIRRKRVTKQRNKVSRIEMKLKEKDEIASDKLSKSIKTEKKKKQLFDEEMKGFKDGESISEMLYGRGVSESLMIFLKKLPSHLNWNPLLTHIYKQQLAKNWILSILPEYKAIDFCTLSKKMNLSESEFDTLWNELVKLQVALKSVQGYIPESHSTIPNQPFRWGDSLKRHRIGFTKGFESIDVQKEKLSERWWVIDYDDAKRNIRAHSALYDRDL